MKLYIVNVLILICFLSACKKDHCTESLLITKHFESDYGCADTKHALMIDLNNNCTVIQSKADYDSKVTGTCHPEIDFTQYDLVIGKQSSGNWNDTILYDLRHKCPEDELTLTVDIIQTDLTQPDNVVYHALIPKLGSGETLKIKVNVE